MGSESRWSLELRGQNLAKSTEMASLTDDEYSDDTPVPRLAADDAKEIQKFGMDEVTPDGLAYHVNTMDLEIDKQNFMIGESFHGY